jgi:hypothetical protein
MGSKTQRKPEKRSATKPRVAVAPGAKKVSPRKASKPGKPAKKVAAKKAVAKKAPPRKPAAKKAAAKKVAPRKQVKKPAPKQAVKKATAKKAAAKAAPKKVAPPAKKAPVKAPSKAAAVTKAAPTKAAAAKAAPAKPAVAQKAAAPVKAAAPAKAAAPVKAAPVKAAPPVKPAKPEAAPKAAKAPKPVKEAAPEAEVAKGAARAAPEAAAVPAIDAAAPASPPVAPRHGAPPMGPRKRGRKRRDPLDDLLKPEKQKRRPGRPRKRGPLGELNPKRARLRKRIRGRRSGDDDMDLPVTPRPPAPRDTMSPAEIRADVIAKYLRGETPTCPVGCGGLAQVVRIATAANGAGEVWFECLSCAQRERFEVPAPTAEERDAVFAVLEAGNEPLCKRHNGRWIQLRRRGRDLACPECGILIQGR